MNNLSFYSFVTVLFLQINVNCFYKNTNIYFNSKYETKSSKLFNIINKRKYTTINNQKTNISQQNINDNINQEAEQIYKDWENRDKSKDQRYFTNNNNNVDTNTKTNTNNGLDSNNVDFLFQSNAFSFGFNSPIVLIYIFSILTHIKYHYN